MFEELWRDLSEDFNFFISRKEGFVENLKHKNLPQTVATEILDIDVPREEVLLKLLYGEGFRTDIQFEILRELKGIREG